MSDCTQSQDRLIEMAGDIGKLPEETKAHVTACEPCQIVAKKSRNLRRLAKTTQELLEEDVALSPGAWARIRQAVDDEARPEPFMALFLRWFPVAVLPVLIIALGWTLIQGSGTTDGEEVAHGGLAVVQDSVNKPPLVVASSGDFSEMGTAPGTTITSGAGAAVANFRSGHSVEFRPDSKVDVVSLSDNRVALRLEKGQITCEVRKLRADESFVVYAKGMRVSVVGTRFTVRLSSDGVPSVSVDEGRVAVTLEDEEKETLLNPGEQLEGTAQSLVSDAQEAEPEKLEQPVTAVSGIPVTKPVSTGSKANRKGRREQPKAKSETTQLVDAPASAPAETPDQVAERVIEVNVSEAMEPTDLPTDSVVRERLVGILGMIRSGNCSSALQSLKKVNVLDGAARFRGDITYLSAYCHRKKGATARASRLFDLYKKLDAKQRWKVPESETEVLPTPSASRLQR